MDWMQTYTIVSTTLGACFFLYLITSRRIDRTDQMIDLNNKNHREDMKKMENFHREDMNRMDEKWERLFEKLLLKEQGKEG